MIPNGLLTQPFNWGELNSQRVADLPVLVFRQGDTNSDAAVDISDALKNFDFLFAGNEKPSCMDAADSNADASVDISDGLSILKFLFAEGLPLPAPGAHSCGIALSRPLGCTTYGVCTGDAGGGRLGTPADSAQERRRDLSPRESLSTKTLLLASLLPVVESRTAPQDELPTDPPRTAPIDTPPEDNNRIARTGRTR